MVRYLDYSMALPTQIGAIFTLRSGEDTLKGTYTGSFTPMFDSRGQGSARLQASGQVISVTAGFINFFLNYVLVEDVVRMVEGTGTGSTGTMLLKPAT